MPSVPRTLAWVQGTACLWLAGARVSRLALVPTVHNLAARSTCWGAAGTPRSVPSQPQTWVGWHLSRPYSPSSRG